MMLLYIPRRALPGYSYPFSPLKPSLKMGNFNDNVSYTDLNAHGVIVLVLMSRHTEGGE